MCCLILINSQYTRAILQPNARSDHNQQRTHSILQLAMQKPGLQASDSSKNLRSLEGDQLDLKIPLYLDHKKLYKLLKSTTIIHSINLSEESVRTADWTVISDGLIKNTSVSEIRFHSIDITQDNIEFIVKIIKGNTRIVSIRLDNWTILPNSFDTLCQSFQEAPNLAEIEISRDSLTEEQLQKITTSYELSTSLKRLTIFKDPVYLAYNKDQAIELANNGRKFNLVGVKELALGGKDPFTRHWAHALRCNQTLTSLELQVGLLISDWKNICEGIAGNYSLTELILNGTQHNLITTPILRDALIANPRITKLVMKKAKIEEGATDAMTDLIRSCKLRSVKISVVDCEDSEKFIETAYHNSEIKHLSFDGVRLTTRIYDLIYNCPHITDLRISESVFPKSPENESAKIAYLTRLDIENMKEVPESLLQAVKVSETLKEFNLISWRSSCTSIINILSVNPTLTKLSLLTPLTENDMTTISQALANHRSLKSLKITLPRKTNHLLCQALMLNTTLEDLTIQTSHGFIDDEYYTNFGNIFASNSSLKSISLPATVDKVVADNMIAKLKSNDTLTRLHLALDGPAFTSNYVYSELTTVLQTNRALNTLISVGEIKKKVVDMLDENKRKQQEFIKHAYSLIKMIKLRLDAFEDIAPLEVWVMIVKQMRHPGVNIDFGKELLNFLKK